MDPCVIYLLTFPSGLSYIGQTTRERMSQRMREHRCASHNPELPVSRAVAKYGLPEPRILLVCEPGDADRYEALAIEHFGTMKPNGYNLDGGGRARRILSDETRRRLSEAARRRFAAETQEQRELRLASLAKGRKPSASRKRGAKRMTEAGRCRLPNLVH